MLGRLPPLLLVLLPSQALDTGEQNSNKKMDPGFGNLRMRLKRWKRKP